jgi:hypothetical protein
VSYKNKFSRTLLLAPTGSNFSARNGSDFTNNPASNNKLLLLLLFTANGLSPGGSDYFT